MCVVVVIIPVIVVVWLVRIRVLQNLATSSFCGQVNTLAVRTGVSVEPSGQSTILKSSLRLLLPQSVIGPGSPSSSGSSNCVRSVVSARGDHEVAA